MNLEIRKLEETIIHAVNTSQIPTEAKRLVVADVLRKLEVQAEKDILVEIQMAEKKKEESKKEGVADE